MAVRPSRMSSPWSRSSRPSFMSAFAKAYRFTVAVRALRNPSSCMPPSTVAMPLAKLWIPSW